MAEPRHPEPVYQTPDWETPSHPLRASLLDRIKEFPRRKNAPLFVRAPSDGTQHAPAKEGELGAGAALPSSQPTRSPLQRRLDAVLPPHRTYLGGRSRRFLLLCLAALLLAVVLALAIGLGVGLSHKKSSTKNLPLPSNHGVFTGDLTYYGPGLGACGVTSSDGDAIVSVSHITFDAAGANRDGGGNPNANPLCGKKIRIQRDYKEGGGAGGGGGNRSVDVTVVDRCTGCQPADLDTTISVFTQLAPEDSGRVLMSWAWLE
ncbi:hypothetical protein PG993_008527 [Apiospora rasikravindrae]|uniref:RlpA-like protein double-psi beta-barrel domain-containing protein n=1 Tax=Apiospora rasikravindrae TaxID=990691 RepID=A0ABR1T232_9PEZI